jgi:hypothetical protein
MFFPGQQVEIKPAYNHETGIRDIWDEIAGCGAEVIRECNDADVLVWINKIGEVFVNRGRLRTHGAI